MELTILPNIIKLVQLGFSGAAIALAYFAFKLIQKEQDRTQNARKSIIHTIQLFLGFSLILSFIMAFLTFREKDNPVRLKNSKPQLSGYWLQSHERDDHKKMYSLVKIGYNSEKKQNTMQEYTFQVIDTKGNDSIDVKLYASWSVMECTTINSGYKIVIDYHYSALIYSAGKMDDPNRNTVYGDGKAIFINNNGLFNTGHGYYNNEKMDSTRVLFIKLDPTSCPLLKEYKHYAENAAEIIRAYYLKQFQI